MAPQQPDETDRHVRESFDVEPAAIRRVVDAARAAADRQPRRGWALRTAAAAAFGVAALAAAVAWWPAAQPPATLGAPEGDSITGSLTDGVLVLTWPDGSTSILGADRGDERPPDGVGIVLVEGGSR
jgi:ferric-dicitrate binding protein FerR (iron transport regulator)